MSIRTEILNRIAEGRLVKLGTCLSSDPKLRQMYLTSELYDEVTRDREDREEAKRFAELTYDLGTFITNSVIYPVDLKLLRPKEDGIWEIRSVEPEPQIRVFGMFADKDIFIGTHYVERDILGDWDSFEWKNEIKRAKRIWDSLFLAYSHKTSTDPNNLFTGALNEQY